jgi:hypothetical protein
MAGTIAPNIVTDGLVLYLDAANTKSYVSGSTTWNDMSTNGVSSTLTAATSSLNAIEFTRTNNTRATIPTLDLSSTNVITVDFWVNFKTLPTVSGYSGDYGRIICELSDNFNSFFDSFLIDVEYELTGFRWLTATRGNGVANSGYNLKNLITPLPVINTWYNASFQINHTLPASNQMSFYLNGVLQTNIGITSNNGITYNAQNTNNFGNRIFRIGGRATTSISQDMYLANFKIYNRSLSASEVLQNYNATKTRFGL